MSDLTPHIKRLLQFNAVLVAVAVVFVAFEAGKTLKEFRYVGEDVPAHETISVAGEGEAFAQPDVARFSFSVIEEAETVADAQASASEREARALEALSEQGIEETDIKTVSYNLSPRYEYQSRTCREGFCPPRERELVGYEVRETISVKVRDIAQAGDLIGAMGGVGVQNISGLTFEVDDEDTVRAEAREKAIADARAKAQKLAEDLGVKLVRIVNFNESGQGVVPYQRYGLGGMQEASDASVPSVPAGENRIVSNVNITYEIR